MTGSKYTQDKFVKRVKEKYNGKYTVVGEYIGYMSPVELMCNQCGVKFTRIASGVLRTRGNTCCPICDKNLITRNCVVKGKNDLWTTNREIAVMLKNPDDGYKYTNGSNVKVPFVCIKCGNVNYKTIAQVVRYGYSCTYCSDGVKYPNKFMANLLSLNNIDYDTEYSIPNYNYRYDFHFVINGDHYLVEMDGGMNHGCVDLPNMTIKDQQANDFNKDTLAENYGYQLIRIDCKYPDNKSRFSYIKDHIINSDLRFLLNDISDNVLNRCDDIAATTSLIVEMANAWNGGVCSQEELQNKFKITSATVNARLKIAVKIGLIDDSYEVVAQTLKESGIRKRSYALSQAVMCNETGKVFPSISAAMREGYTTVGAYLNNKIKYAGKLFDGTELTWKRITKEEYEKLYAS